MDRDTYDRSIITLHDAMEGARLDKKEKYQAIKRLTRICDDQFAKKAEQRSGHRS